MTTTRRPSVVVVPRDCSGLTFPRIFCIQRRQPSGKDDDDFSESIFWPCLYFPSYKVMEKELTKVGYYHSQNHMQEMRLQYVDKIGNEITENEDLLNSNASSSNTIIPVALLLQVDEVIVRPCSKDMTFLAHKLSDMIHASKFSSGLKAALKKANELIAQTMRGAKRKASGAAEAPLLPCHDNDSSRSKILKYGSKQQATNRKATSHQQTVRGKTTKEASSSSSTKEMLNNGSKQQTTNLKATSHQQAVRGTTKEVSSTTKAKSPFHVSKSNGMVEFFGYTIHQDSEHGEDIFFCGNSRRPF